MTSSSIEVTPTSHTLWLWQEALANVPAQRPGEALDVGRGDAVLVVGAHPDDETFGVAGTMASLATGGVDVHVVSMSSGEAALDHVGVTVAGLALRRRFELGEAGEMVGAASVDALGFPDGRLADFETEMALTIEAAARRHGVARILTVAWCDPHPDHAAVARATLEAAARCRIPVTGYAIWALHWTDPDDPTMRMSPMTLMSLDQRARAARRAAIGCYGTQTEPMAANVAAILPPSFVGNDLELLFTR